MDRKALARVVDEVFLSCGFKRKGYYWIDNRGEIIKLVNLQKSNFGNQYYVNFGYVIRALQLDGLKMHIFSRLSSAEAGERRRIQALLDLDSSISDECRESQLIEVLNANVLRVMNRVNSEVDLSIQLRSAPTLDTIPGIVKTHLKLND
jgi:hypothetical protein